MTERNKSQNMVKWAYVCWKHSEKEERIVDMMRSNQLYEQ